MIAFIFSALLIWAFIAVFGGYKVAKFVIKATLWFVAVVIIVDIMYEPFRVKQSTSPVCETITISPGHSTVVCPR